MVRRRWRAWAASLLRSPGSGEPPPPGAGGTRSSRSTVQPKLASSTAIWAPMVPEPRTATRRMRSGTSGSLLVRRSAKPSNRSVGQILAGLGVSLFILSAGRASGLLCCKRRLKAGVGDGRLFAWLLYGGFSLAATAVMLALLLGAARQGNRRARLVTLTMVWLLPTHLLLAVSAVVALLGWEWVHPWWPLADWAALMFMAGLLRLAVDDWLVAAGPGDDPAPARRLAKHPWAIYVP